MSMAAASVSLFGLLATERSDHLIEKRSLFSSVAELRSRVKVEVAALARLPVCSKSVWT